jgi:hypothetical protein
MLIYSIPYLLEWVHIKQKSCNINELGLFWLASKLIAQIIPANKYPTDEFVLFQKE